MRCNGNSLSRRSLLTVGALGGLGLTLADFFQIKKAQAEQKSYDFIEAKAHFLTFVFANQYATISVFFYAQGFMCNGYINAFGFELLCNFCGSIGVFAWH